MRLSVCPPVRNYSFHKGLGNTYDILSPPGSPTQLVTPMPPPRRGRLFRLRRLLRSEDAVRVCRTCWLRDLWQLPPPLVARRRPVALLPPVVPAGRPWTATTSWPSPKPPAELIVSVDCGVAAVAAAPPGVPSPPPAAGCGTWDLLVFRKLWFTLRHIRSILDF